MLRDELDTQTSEKLDNIDLSVFNKKKFTINGNTDRILELDISDLNIVTRFKEQYGKLQKLAEKVGNIKNTEGLSDEELIDETASKLKEIDTEMRQIVDTIFDSNVSEICVPSGSMYDPINGKFRYEHLIDTLIKLYDDNLTKETKKIKANIGKYTNKYSKKR